MPRFAKFLILYGLAALTFSFAVFSLAAGGKQKPEKESGLVRVEQVEVRLSIIGPVVLLKVRNKAIPIFVDAVVAESIHGALTGEKSRRPLSHDLMRTILEAFDGRVSQAIITLKEGTYYADLTVVMRDTTNVFDSRSSDAIALAIRFKAPILVSPELLDSAGKELEEPDGKRL